MPEIWKTLPSNSDYEISTEGRVRGRAGRLKWLGPRAGFGTLQEQILRPGIASNGYPTVCLGRGDNRTIHSLVAETFIGPVPEGCEVRHKDGDRKNPRFENLEYGTRAENIEDAFIHGTRQRGRRYYASARNR